MSTKETSPAPPEDALPEYAPIPESSFGPALNQQGYAVGRVERNLYWVTDGVYQAAFLTTPDGVVLFDAPPSIGHNLQRAIDEIAQANGVSNKVTYLVHTHHHADHGGASSLFGKDVVRIGHEETRRLLLRDDDPARPAPEETFSDRRTLEIGGERIELAWHGANHTPDNSVIHFPEHDALMMVDIVNVGWVPVYVVNLSDDIPGYLSMPATALTYPWKTLISVSCSGKWMTLLSGVWLAPCHASSIRSPPISRVRRSLNVSSGAGLAGSSSRSRSRRVSSCPIRTTSLPKREDAPAWSA